MTHPTSNSHLPYAIRYMARLQEQAARTAPGTVPADRLQKCATHLRVTARSFEPVVQDGAEVTPHVLTQKLKLLNFLRQER